MTALAPSIPAQSNFIIEPSTVDETGIDRGLLWDLTLKTLFFRGRMSRMEISNALMLSGSVMEEVMQALSQDSMVTVTGSGGGGPAGYIYTPTQKGLDRAEAALSRSGYVGPCPVPLTHYAAQVGAQTIGDVTITRHQIREALGPLVLGDETLSRLGRAASSRKSTLVYGASGNGKTTAVNALGAALAGSVRIPYAIEVVGQIVHLYDPSKHERAEGEPDTYDDGLTRNRADRRWLWIKRPVIWTGGELTKHSLELVHDDTARVYEAPLQLKANGGTLIIDDFGRQQMPAVQLLNRWITALEGGIDHLTLHTGQTVEVPFDVLVLFSTNLSPDRLADEAFLRRIRYKVEVPNPTRDEYRAIFRDQCAALGVPFEEAAVAHLFANWYDAHKRELRGCHPRDIIEAVVDAAKYDGRPAVMTRATLDEACATYFLRPV